MTHFTRRHVILATGAAALSLRAGGARATPAAMEDAIAEAFSGTPASGRITLTAPPLAETGNSVPVKIAVESPMTQDDYVTRIGVYASENPRPRVGLFTLTPATGVAQVEFNMRLSTGQDVVVVAEMSDGSLFRLDQHIVVQVGACTTLNARY